MAMNGMVLVGWGVLALSLCKAALITYRHTMSRD